MKRTKKSNIEVKEKDESSEKSSVHQPTSSEVRKKIEDILDQRKLDHLFKL